MAQKHAPVRGRVTQYVVIQVPAGVSQGGCVIPEAIHVLQLVWHAALQSLGGPAVSSCCSHELVSCSACESTTSMASLKVASMSCCEIPRLLKLLVVVLGNRGGLGSRTTKTH